MAVDLVAVCLLEREFLKSHTDTYYIGPAYINLTIVISLKFQKFTGTREFIKVLISGSTRIKDQSSKRKPILREKARKKIPRITCNGKRRQAGVE